MPVIEARRNQDGTTSYRARITLRGHPRLSRTFSRKTDARTWAQQTEAAIRERRYFPDREGERRTLGELVDRFVAERLPLRATRDRARLEGQLQWWAKELGRETRLAELTPARIVEVRDQLNRGKAPSGRQVSPATVKRYMALLSKALAVAAKEWFWIRENPCRQVPRPTEPRGRVRFLSDDERTRLLEACRASRDPRLHPLVLLALATGARQGELLSLRWGDVDPGRGVAILQHTKNGDRRALPITGAALGALRTFGKVRRLDTDRVFAGRRGKAAFPRREWHRAMRTARLDDFRFHDLRHSAASYLAMSGATLAEIAEVLGHKTLAMVKRYAHLTEGHTRSVVERMTGRFLG